jgi:chlorophyll synthase
MNLARQPLVTGEITLKRASYSAFLFFILSLFIASLINLSFFLLVLFIDILGYIYSMPPTRLKEKPVGDIICNALLGTSFFMAGLNIEGTNINPIIIVGVFLMAANFYIPTVITDHEFDEKAGLKTSAVYFGLYKLIRLMYILTLGVVLTGIIVYLISNFELQLLAILMVSYTIIFTGVTKKKTYGKRLNLHENWILIPFSFISLLFSIYGILKLTGIII